MAYSSAESGTLEALVSGWLPTTLVVPDNPTMQTQVLDTAENVGFDFSSFDDFLSFDDFSGFLETLPPGYRFCPTEEELVLNYLLPKINNISPKPHPIHDVDLYRHNPDYLAERYGDYGLKQWYFFTPRDKKYPKGKRPNRDTGDGYWKATGDKPITSANKIKVGSKKSLVFYKGRPPRGTKTQWLMQEYTVDGAPQPTNQQANSMRLDEWVLCKIYKGPQRSNTQP